MGKIIMKNADRFSKDYIELCKCKDIEIHIDEFLKKSEK